MDWHKRYRQQASWTRDLRSYLLRTADISHAQRILEVGCGTGVVLHDAEQWARGTERRSFSSCGLDMAMKPLLQCRRHEPLMHLTQGDALALPFPDRAFDITFCHFLLLWVGDPLLALREMQRVTRQDGHVLALAEPDYGTRVDRPEAFALLGRLQEQSLVQQGADPTIGSRLAELFRVSGLDIVESGTLAPWEHRDFSAEDFEGEWDILREDLRGMLPEADLDRMMEMDAQARRQGRRILYVPVYFVHAQV